MPDAALAKASERSIVQGSKSFSLASFFFARREREACHLLYHFCRHCDDAIDRADSPAGARAALERLRLELRGGESAEPAMRAFREVQTQFRIPTDYANDLLAGFETDVNGALIRDESDLALYSYRVAGVVGLMMCQIMGLSDPLARRQAIDLGIAMQMTNIARDVLEDFEQNRVYLPETWLREAGLSRDAILARPAETFSVVLRLLDRADERYRSGLAGLRALPVRAALAVSMAAAIYSAIGRKIRRKGPAALSERTYVGRAGKLLCALHGALRVTPILFSRMAGRRWQAAPLEDVWRFEA